MNWFLVVGWALFAVALTAGAVIVLFAVLVGLGMDPFGDEPAPPFDDPPARDLGPPRSAP